MDWPIPEFNEAQVREKEREAAKYGKYALAAVAKMYQRLGKPQQAIDCYKLAKRPTKVRRVEGEKVYNIKETLSVHGWKWYRVGRDGAQVYVDFIGELYYTLGDYYLATISYLDAKKDAQFRHWQERSDNQKGPNIRIGRSVFSEEVVYVWPDGCYPKFARVPWNAMWSADLAERDGKLEIASRIRKSIDHEIKTFTKFIDPAMEGTKYEYDFVDDIAECAVKCLENGVVNNAIRHYRRWYNLPLEGSFGPYEFYRMAPGMFYSAGDMSEALQAIEKCREYTGTDAEKFKNDTEVERNLSRTETLILWRLGRIDKAAVCFENLVKNAANRCDWEKEDHYNDYHLYEYEEDLSALATLWELAGNEAKRKEVLQAYEFVSRSQGCWNSPVIEYYFRDMFTEMERVCREEDELDVAAYLYEKAGKTEDAARMYEEMAGGEAEKASIAAPIESEKTKATQVSGKCPSCGAEVGKGEKFCGECGVGLSAVCRNCGTEVKEAKKFCTECGAKLE